MGSPTNLTNAADWLVARRPETSFLWFTSPWKTIKLLVWDNYKWKCLCLLILLLIILFLFLAIYRIPVSSNQIKSFYSLIKNEYVLHMTVHELDKQCSHRHAKMDEKLKSENMQKNSSFLCLCYILRTTRAGRCREWRYADRMFI